MTMPWGVFVKQSILHLSSTNEFVETIALICQRETYKTKTLIESVEHQKDIG